jgi:nuclear pore complex protein Nup107
VRRDPGRPPESEITDQIRKEWHSWTSTLMSETFYTSCADVLALFQAQKDNLEALLDPQTGFAPRLRQLCEQQCVLHNPDSKSFLAHSFSRLSDIREEGNATPEEIEALRMECSTWALLQAIMPCV